MGKWFNNLKTRGVCYMDEKEMTKLSDQMERWYPKNGEWVILKDINNKESFTVVKYSDQYRGFDVEPFVNDFPKHL